MTQGWLLEIAELEAFAKRLLEQAKRERAEVLEAIDRGARVEPGPYKVKIRTRWRHPFRMDLSSTGSGQGNLRVLELPTIVTQQWLAEIAALEAFSKSLLQQARGERAKVLEAIQAGAPVEPGKYKVQIRTRWVRRKAS